MSTELVILKNMSRPSKKPVEFMYRISFDCTNNAPFTVDTTCKPSDYTVVELICRNDFDTMFAYNGANRNKGFTFFGHWNDGVL